MPSLLADRSARNAALGFLLSGMLMGGAGSLSVAWRYQLDKDPRSIGLHFLILNASVLLSGIWCQAALGRFTKKAVCLWACLASCVGFVELAAAAPPAHSAWRMIGLALVGGGAGLILSSLLRFVRPYYRTHAASTVNFCALLFGSGSLLVTVTIGSTYSLFPPYGETLLLASLPVGFAVIFWRDRARGVRADSDVQPSRKPPNDLRRVAAILFSLTLLLQFGSEWSLANWLPLLLIHRLGLSPESAIFVLGLYFLALLTGRLVVQALLPYMRPARLLFGSLLLSMFGYLLLSLTESAVGAALATVLTGLAFAPVYALVVMRIGRRFDEVPGFFSTIFSLAMTGGMLLPGALGFVSYYAGMQYLLVLPAVCSAAVLVLMLLMMLEAKLMGPEDEADSTRPAAKNAAAAGAGGRS